MDYIMQVVIRTINFIRAKGLNDHKLTFDIYLSGETDNFMC